MPAPHNITKLYRCFLVGLRSAGSRKHAGCEEQQVARPRQPEIYVCFPQFLSLNISICKANLTIQSSSVCFWLGIFPASTMCFLQRFSTEIIAKYFKALDMENIFQTLHHYTFLGRGNEPSVSIIGLTHTAGQQASTSRLCIPGPAAFV